MLKWMNSGLIPPAFSASVLHNSFIIVTYKQLKFNRPIQNQRIENKSIPGFLRPEQKTSHKEPNFVVVFFATYFVLEKRFEKSGFRVSVVGIFEF